MTFIKYSLFLFIFYLLIGFISAIPVQKNISLMPPNIELIKKSEQILYAIKLGNSSLVLEEELKSLNIEILKKGLPNDDAKKTFWINIYNAYYQILATREKLNKSTIFTSKIIVIANQKFSLDDIEHGILRKYRWKYSMGYLPQFFAKKIIKQLAVQEIDFRIHFAMNCGAKSCPPIAFYSYEKINKQLDQAATSFLENDVQINEEEKKVNITKIMSWFLGDFGGKSGIRAIIQQYLNKNVDGYAIKFKDYDWNPALNNFVIE